MGIDLSHSRLSALQMCGEYYRRRYEDRDQRPGTPRMIRGSAVAEVAAESHRRQIEAKKSIGATGDAAFLEMLRITTESLPSEDEAADLAATAFDRRASEGVTVSAEDAADAGGSDKAAVGQAKDATVDMATFYVAEVAPRVNPVAFERKITIKPQDSDVTLRAVLDLVEVEPDGKELIPDLKTTERTPGKNVAEQDQQLTFYAMARQAETGRLPDAEALRFVVRTPKEHRVSVVERRTVVTPDDVDAVVGRINAAVAAIRAGIFIPAAPNHWKCLSLDTEIMCRDGWKGPESVSEASEVATLNPHSHLIEMQHPTRVIRQEHKGRRMVEYDGRTISFKVTPDHSMLVKSTGSARWRRADARLLEGKTAIAFPTSGYMLRQGANLSDDLIRLSGWLSAEGHFRQDCAMVEIGQKFGTPGFVAIESLLRRIGGPFSINRFMTPTGEVANFRLKQPFASRIRSDVQPSKALPGWLWSADARQFRVWLETFGMGDGSLSPNGLAVSQKDEAFIDSLQAMCVTQRISAIKNPKRQRSSTGGEFSSLSLLPGVTARTIGLNVDRPRWVHGSESESVWCVSVPNETMVTRHRGRVVIMGNCSARWCEFFVDCPYAIRRK